MSLLSMLDKTLTHKTSVTTQGAIGGAGQAFTTVDSSVPCAVWGASARTVRDLMRDDILGDHVVATAQNLSVVSGDQLIVGSDYYIVNGVIPYDHILLGTLYIHDCTKRTV